METAGVAAHPPYSEAQTLGKPRGGPPALSLTGVSVPPHYLAIPTRGSGRGVLVLHSWWGLNDFFKGLCDRFGEAGFVAMAPDLYAGKVACNVAQARQLRTAATAARRIPAYKQLIAAINHLSRHEAVSSEQVALVGFSMGGHWALWLSQRPELPVSDTVVFYAARNGDYSHSHARFLLHLADTDDWVSPASVKKLLHSLDAAGRDVTSYRYPGTSHWFFEADQAQAFHPNAAALAWKRTLEFLNPGTSQ